MRLAHVTMQARQFFLSSRLLFPCLYNRVSGGKVTEKQEDENQHMKLQL